MKDRANCAYGNTDYQYIWVNSNVIKEKSNKGEQRRFNYFNYKTWACEDIKTLNAFLNSEFVGNHTFILTGGVLTDKVIDEVVLHNA